MNEAKVKKYFERIGLKMPETIIPDYELLKKLAFHNIISIPYENLQFLTKQFIPCDTDSLFQRIVVEKKGGICHDIAGLFGWFLSELGYTVIQIGTKSFSPKLGPHIHKSLIVTDCTGTEWLTEIGYTPYMINKAPIRFITDIDQTFGSETFRIEERDGKKCLIGPTDIASYRIEYWDIGPEIGNRIKELTIEGNDPVGIPKRSIDIGTPEGRRILYGNTYKEYFGESVYSYECTPEMLPWAYAQFGLEYKESDELY